MGASLGSVGDVKWDGELCRPTSGTPKGGREVGCAGWVTTGAVVAGGVNPSRAYSSRISWWVVSPWLRIPSAFFLNEVR